MVTFHVYNLLCQYHYNTRFTLFTRFTLVNLSAQSNPLFIKTKMRSQIFAGLAFGIVAVVAGAPVESSASEEQITINGAVFVRKDSNSNDNWDAITYVGLTLTTPSGSVSCDADSFPDPSVPSNVYTCADPTYSFQISSRPSYNVYAVTVTHKVSDRYASLFS